MKSFKYWFVLAVLLGPLVLFVSSHHEVAYERGEDKYRPSDWFWQQRANTRGDVPLAKYLKAVSQKQQMLALRKPAGNLIWQQEGPTNIGGRITALDVDIQHSVIFAAAAAGGVMRSSDNGATWALLTDYIPSLSVGALKLSPDNPRIVYCGTGEANISIDSYAGSGMLKSTDAGDTWNNAGLDSVQHIGKIEVHPMSTNQIFVAASGGLYSKSIHRGIYRSTDAGKTWYKTLYLNDSTSAIDVAVDPNDTAIVYAAMWERLRGPSFRKSAGINTGMYRSTDGGWNWSLLGKGLPAPDAKMGRISIAVAPSNSNYVYALYHAAETANGTTNIFYNFYRSTDKGVSWAQMPAGMLPGSFSNFGWYFGLIQVDPVDPQKVYVGDIDLFRSTDGGGTWTNITNSYSGSFDMQHPDQHALWIDPRNTNHMVNGNDGGVFESNDGGQTWTKKYNLPITQFYASTIDNLDPRRLYGGSQDNGTYGTKTGALSDWTEVNGGDGFHCLVDYTNSDIIYAESQNGNIVKTIDGGMSSFSITNGLDLSRTNWSTPFEMDPVNPQTLYLGSWKLFQTDNGGTQWRAVSPDLTRGANGRLGTITAIAVAPAATLAQRFLYVATDDAKLSVSTDGGLSWNDRTGNLPRRYMTDVVADLRTPEVAYVSLSGYNLDEITPRIYRTGDAGLTWTDMSGNLPDAPVNSLVIDYNYDAVLYAGTDVGVFYSSNNGVSWNVLGSGLPNSPVFDLNLHQATGKLVAATHGRSMFSVNVANLISRVDQTSTNDKSFIVEQNYPNPFNPVTILRYRLPFGGDVVAKIYDVTGKEVMTLLHEVQPAGQHQVALNAASLSSGIYYAQFTAGSLSKTIKVVLLK